MKSSLSNSIPVLIGATRVLLDICHVKHISPSLLRCIHPDFGVGRAFTKMRYVRSCTWYQSVRRQYDMRSKCWAFVQGQERVGWVSGMGCGRRWLVGRGVIDRLGLRYLVFGQETAAKNTRVLTEVAACCAFCIQPSTHTNAHTLTTAIISCCATS